MKKPPGEAFQPPAPRQDVRVEANRCPFCRDDVLPEESVACQDCLTRHHRACWIEGSGCSSCRGVNLLEPARAPEPEPDRYRPTSWKESDGSYTAAATYRGKLLRATTSPFFTKLSLFAGETLLGSATRSWLTMLWQGMRTWFGETPTWELEADWVLAGVERRVRAVHHVSFSSHFVQIYVDGELIGPAR